MTLSIMAALILVIPATYLFSRYIRAMAIQHHILDIPNSRSSHHAPTPRGGGLSFTVIILVTCLILSFYRDIPFKIIIALFVAGSSVATVGWLDDKKGLPILSRFLVHILAALWLTYWLESGERLLLGAFEIPWGKLGLLFFTLASIWLINLYNFMDGIDGLAASEAITACFAGGIILWGTQSTIPALITGAAVLGFIPWNWPSAKVFMGDVGSGFLGFLFACLWICSTDVPGGFFIWPILLGVFIVDATFTLLWRIYRKEKWYASHRSHAYQIAAIHWGHAPVTKAVIMINLLWLTPCAVLCRIYPGWSITMTIIAYMPLIIVYGKMRQLGEKYTTTTASGNPQATSANPQKDSANPHTYLCKPANSSLIYNVLPRGREGLCQNNDSGDPLKL